MATSISTVPRLAVGRDAQVVELRPRPSERELEARRRAMARHPAGARSHAPVLALVR